VAAQSKVCGHLRAEILGSNSAGCIRVCLRELFELSGRGLCGELITHPEEYYRMWCVVVSVIETS
jgi:hypothetical protein